MVRGAATGAWIHVVSLARPEFINKSSEISHSFESWLVTVCTMTVYVVVLCGQ